MSEIPGYSLIDSGHGRKLEKYGDKVLNRPSSLSEWKPRQSPDLWEQADATLTPPSGWEFSKKPFSTWEISVANVKLQLELMSNGQLGIFPEHALYLPSLGAELTRLQLIVKRPLKVLNLFAYSGLATCFCAQHSELQVTHVDLAKRAIEWAKTNAALNEIPGDRIRWIVDDALAFMAREGRKENRYDMIIIDPPSFSRITKTNTWTLEQMLPEIVHLFLGVLNIDAGVVFFTNHSSASTLDIARNIALDYFNDDQMFIETRPLSLKEESSPRLLPAGSLIWLAHTRG
jgi:23S rRNA (cytosine1962-C5)-methyltransferase